MSPEPHGPQDLPKDPRIVAKISYPMPLGSFSPLVKALEKMYGKGLVVLMDGDSEWMNVALPSEPKK